MAIESSGDVQTYLNGAGYRQEAIGVVLLGGEGGGGGSSEVAVTNWPDEQPVTGPATMAELSGIIGLLNSQAYGDDTGAADGTLIGLLKGIYVQNAQIIALLTQIETNTAATP